MVGRDERVVVLPSDLDWMAMQWAGDELVQLSFGYASAAAAFAALGQAAIETTRVQSFNRDLEDRLQDYAAGGRQQFGDVRIVEWGTDVQRRVRACCRQIGYGQTASYAELAARAGIPGAARAVGTCMATNRVPLIVPCHRVVASGGRLGGYSAPDGVRMKRRLLDLERNESSEIQGSLFSREDREILRRQRPRIARASKAK